MPAWVIAVIGWVWTNIVPRLVWGKDVSFTTATYAPRLGGDNQPVAMKFYGLSFDWGVLGVVRRDIQHDVTELEAAGRRILDEALAKQGKTPSA